VALSVAAVDQYVQKLPVEMVFSGRKRKMFVVGVSSFAYALLKLEECPWRVAAS
jgi:hypothetical protein